MLIPILFATHWGVTFWRADPKKGTFRQVLVTVQAISSSTASPPQYIPSRSFRLPFLAKPDTGDMLAAATIDIPSDRRIPDFRICRKRASFRGSVPAVCLRGTLAPFPPLLPCLLSDICSETLFRCHEFESSSILAVVLR
ncbi:hypothetical protein BKA82DRAFT_2368166 [Pisolithus tinctorius]|nr:hypothetical protein BKA82DRAFT_2368166 [Pisolithus tinctorius]